MARTSTATAPAAWLAISAGVYLVWSALADRSPIGDLRSALGAAAAPTSLVRPSASRGGAGGGTTSTPAVSAAVAAATGSVSGQNVLPEGQTVKVVAGGMTIRLAPQAVAPFKAWEADFGAAIPCTGGWRSCAEADANHAKDPKRFAPCKSSAHTRGMAVDVNNDWLQSLPSTRQSALRLAAKKNGWGQARWKGEASCGNNPNNDNEPWHFSLGTCA